MAHPPKPAPAELYDSWPTTPVNDPVHEIIRQAMLTAARLIDQRYPSVRAASQELGINHSVLRMNVSGGTWPTAETVAKLEVGLDHGLWPKYRQQN